MAIDSEFSIVFPCFPMKNGGSFRSDVKLPEGKHIKIDHFATLEGFGAPHFCWDPLLWWGGGTWPKVMALTDQGMLTESQGTCDAFEGSAAVSATQILIWRPICPDAGQKTFDQRHAHTHTHTCQALDNSSEYSKIHSVRYSVVDWNKTHFDFDGLDQYHPTWV